MEVDCPVSSQEIDEFPCSSLKRQVGKIILGLFCLWLFKCVCMWHSVKAGYKIRFSST